MDAGRKVQVEILPSRITATAPLGARLFDVLQEHGLATGSCNGLGRCGQCRVRWLSPAPPATETECDCLAREEIGDGWRLSCQHALTDSVRLWVSSGQPLIDAKRFDHAPLQNGTKVVERVIVPHRRALGALDRSQADQLSSESGRALQWSPAALADLGHLGQEHLGNATLALYVTNQTVLHVENAEQAGAPYGIAVDVGTSVVGLYLVDLERAQIVAAQSRVNPQTVYGGDVMSRISYVQAQGEQGRARLQRLIRRELDCAISHLAGAAGINRGSIYHMRVVGNPTMLHLFFGIDPQSLGRAPFTPVFSGVVSCSSADVEVPLAEGARVDCLPAVSGFVGSDAVAGALYAGFADSQQTMLLIDVGTNAEVILSHNRRLYGCAAAAGPALEAGRIACGLAAQTGAIDRVRFEGGLKCRTVDGEPPQGVCGSGLIDLLAVLLDLGAVREDGRVVPERVRELGLANGSSHGGIQIVEGCSRLVLSQGDVRQMQLAIAALRGAIEMILAAAGISATDVDRVVVSGSCGVHLNPRSMVRVGILPRPWESRVTALDNAAGRGAAETLTDARLLVLAEHLVAEAIAVPLGGSPTYMERFVRAMRFPSNKKGRETPWG